MVRAELAPTTTVDRIRKWQADLIRLQHRTGGLYLTWDMVEWNRQVADAHFRGILDDWLDPTSWLLWIWHGKQGTITPGMPESEEGFAIDLLGGLKDWIIDHVFDPIMDAFRKVAGWVWDKIVDGLKIIVSAGKWLWNRLSDIVSGAISAMSGVVDWIWDRIEDVWDVVKNVGGIIWEKLTDFGGWVAEKFVDLGESVWSGLKWVGEQTWNALAAVGEYIIAGLRGLFEMFKEIGKWIFEALGSVVVFLLDWGMNVARKITGVITGGTVKEEAFRTKDMKLHLRKLRKELPHSPADIIDWADAFLLPFVGKAAPEVMFEACGIDPKVFPQSMKGVFGLMNMMADLSILTGYVDIAGDITHHIHIKHIGRFVDRLIANSGMSRLIGFGLGTAFGTAIAPQMRYAINQQLKPMVPGMSDLVRMEVREVWRPEFRAEQIEEAPSGDFYKWAAHQGFSEDHADSYWAAHWSLPTITQAYEMYHRLREGRVDSELVFTREDLLKLLRRQDILKRYREQLIAVAYEVPTRREIRMMMETGVIDRAEAENLYLDRGVDPKFAPMLADFAQARAQRDPYQGRWITSSMRHYREGYVDDAGFKELLAKREVPDDLVEDSLEFARLDQEYDYKSEVLRAVRDLFKHGKLTEDEYRSRLREIGLSDERIELYLERDQLHVSVRAAELEEVPEPKTLTKSEILRLYHAGHRTEEWAREKLEDLTIALETIDDLLDLYAPEAPEVEVRKLSRAMCDRAFRDGIIDEDYYLARLLDLGYPEEDAWIWYLVQVHAIAPEKGEVSS